MRTTSPTALIIAGLATVALAACSNGSSSSGSSGTSPTAAGSSLVADCPLTVTDAWVKAAPSGMTAAFATVSNPSAQPATITAASTPAAGKTELHETVDTGGTMTMKQVPALTVPANGQLTLAPGGNHIMLMNIPSPIEPGEDVTVTLTCESGATVGFTAKARTYSGANETYKPGSATSPMSMASPTS